MARVNSCCCFTVRTGTLILGWLGFIVSLIGTLVYGGIKSQEDHIIDTIKQVIDSDQVPPEQREMLENLLPYLSVLFTVVLVLCIIYLAMNGLLLLGVFKKNGGLMLPYLIITMIMLVLQGLNAVVGPWVMGQPLGAAVMNMIVGLLGLALGVYFWFCVFSHYKDVKEEAAARSQSFQPMKA